MSKMSKEKGKHGEREVAELLRKYGFDARRGQQFSGGDGSPDVVHNIEGLHIEVKRTEKFDLESAMTKALSVLKILCSIQKHTHQVRRRPPLRLQVALVLYGTLSIFPSKKRGGLPPQYAQRWLCID